MLISLCIRYHLINKSSAEKGMASSPHFYKVKGMLLSLCIRYHLNNRSLQKRAWPVAPNPNSCPCHCTISASIGAFVRCSSCTTSDIIRPFRVLLGPNLELDT